MKIFQTFIFSITFIPSWFCSIRGLRECLCNKLNTRGVIQTIWNLDIDLNGRLGRCIRGNKANNVKYDSACVGDSTPLGACSKVAKVRVCSSSSRRSPLRGSCEKVRTD